ncbi:MAG: DUF503 domain-containing protein [Deltaproteobacteria bacterium]|jgi:uncharacterized protein YlxP (DUF503 family)|nr:DUF503 domain-containing protein [Deltaproteobacteria bacterium]
MVVGVLEVTLFMEGLDSLKGRRKVVKSLLGRVKARFNAACSEVGGPGGEARDHAVLGFAVCGGDAKILNAVLDRMLDFIEANADAEVVDSRLECLNLGGGDWGEA